MATRDARPASPARVWGRMVTMIAIVALTVLALAFFVGYLPQRKVDVVD